MKIRKVLLSAKEWAVSGQLFLTVCFLVLILGGDRIREILYFMGLWSFPCAALLFFACALIVHAAASKRNREIKFPKIVLIGQLLLAILFAGMSFPNLSECVSTSTLELYCGEKSDQSRGVEIWLHSYEVDGEYYNAASARVMEQVNFSFDDTRQEYSYMSASGGEGYLRLELPKGNRVRLTFLRHSFAGIVRVSVNGGEMVEVDTYAPQGDYYTADFLVKEAGCWDALSYFLFVLGVSGCFCLFLGVEQGIAYVFLKENGNEKKTLFRLAVMVSALFAAGFVFWFYGTDKSAQGAAFWTRLFTLGMLLILGGYILIWKGLLDKAFWKHAKKKKTVLLFGIAALCITLLSGPVLADRAFPNTVEIYCGEKNEQSAGSQVWLSSYTVDGETRNIHSLRTTDLQNAQYRWERGVYLCAGGQGYLRIELPRCESAELGFLGFERGGIIQIAVNGGAPKQVDLFSPHTEGVQVSLDLSVPAKHGIAAYVVFLTAACGCFCVLFLIMAGFGALAIKARDDQRENKRSMMLASVLLPVTILLYFYQNNSDYLPLQYAMLAALMIAAAYAVLFWTMDAAVKSSLAAWSCALLWTLFLYKSELISDRLAAFGIPENQGTFFCLGIAALLSLVILALGNAVKFRANKILSSFLLVFSGVTFAMNVLPILPIAKDKLFADRSLSIKDDFIIEPLKAENAPHIYWIHCDGLLGFSSVEKYYEDDQSELKEALAERGFSINETAYFEAGRSTRSCIPALMCPDFYDAAMRPGIERAETDEAWCKRNVTLLETARDHNEMIEAFRMAGPVHLIGTDFAEEVFIYDDFYGFRYNSVVKKQAWNNAKLQNNLFFTETFTSRFLRPIYYIINNFRKDFDTWEYRLLDGVSGKIESDTLFIKEMVILTEELNEPDSVLTMLAIEEAHFPYGRDENGDWVKDATRNPTDYYPQHQYTLKVILKAVDIILEHDPDAVIVLQADHGLHGTGEGLIKETFGEDAIAAELWNQVFSAVRVPEQYQNGEERYAYENPLNISRYLINRFIGRNYEYLAA